MNTRIIIPTKEGNKEVDFEQVLILLGANGSGKTRLGVYLEKNTEFLTRINDDNDRYIYRITAQKSIQFPESIGVGRLSKTQLRSQLFCGVSFRNEEQILRIRLESLSRYKSDFYDTADIKSKIGNLDDYDFLLQYLFTMQMEIADLDRKNKKISSHESIFEKACRIWGEILPNREIEKQGFELKTKYKNSSIESYSANMMSDGERVIFYLIGQVLIALENSIIIIDEPELHLHKAIMQPLWEKLISERPDCLFIFMTHDINFASRLNNAKKIWLKEFNEDRGNEIWDFEEINYDENIPEDMLLELIGSRRNILFVEGERGSWDFNFYQVLFPDYLVIPCGGCHNVINYTKSFNIHSSLGNHLNVFGIIDRDRRNDDEVNNLRNDNIFVLEVAEVENLFCKEIAIEYIIENQHRENEKSTLIQNIKNRLFVRFQKEFQEQVDLFLLEELKFNIKKLNKNNLYNWKDSVDLDNIKSDLERTFNDVLSTRDYNKLLKYYNRKKLYKEIQSELNLSNDEYPKLLIRILQADNSKISYFVNNIGLNELIVTHNN